jgi:hypothetical protein
VNKPVTIKGAVINIVGSTGTGAPDEKRERR